MQSTATRKTKARTAKAAAAPAESVATRKAIAAAVRKYMAAVAASPEFDAMLAEIDRNLDASEQRTTRLLAQD